MDPSPSSKHVLVVEDEEALASALTQKLRSENFTVTWAANGAEALQKLESEDFDYVLLDLMLPDTDGFTVLEKVHSGKKHYPPITVLSNLSQPEDVEKAKQLGAFDFLVKSNLQLSQIVDYLKSLPNHENERETGS